MSVVDEMREQQEQEDQDDALVRLEVRLAEARRDRDSAKRALLKTEAENKDLQRLVDLFGRIEEADPQPPHWLSPKKPKAHRATLMLMLSDMHFDEVIRPEEVDNLNAYNRQIATMRLQAWTQNAIKLARHYLSGVSYDGFVLMLGGDSFAGIIHDELKETNDDTLFGSLLYWSEMLCAAIDLLLDEIGKGYVVAVPGNHGRQTRKPRAKFRARDNADWLLAQMVASHFRGDKRVEFDVPDSLDRRFEVYGRGQLVAHGDAVSGGGGIGGIWPPIMRYRARLAEHANATDKPFDTLWVGHWHSFIGTQSLVVNGCLSGYDEYAKTRSFAFQVPQQAMALMTPERGMTWMAPVFCADKRKEKW